MNSKQLKLKILTNENLKFKYFETGDKIHNYILLDELHNHIYILSTYTKSKLKYYIRISDFKTEHMDIIINLLKQYTWTIYKHNISAYKNGQTLNLRKYLRDQHIDLNKIKLKTDLTPPQIKLYIHNKENLN